METICTKFIPPLEPHCLLDRPRLREQLDRLGDVRLTVVQAPAGYGKTTLLAQWFDALKSADAIRAWATLDERETGAIALVGSIAAMMAEDARFGAGLDVFFRNEAFLNADGLLATLLERLAAVRVPVYLFLDDAHAIGCEAGRALMQFIHAAPPNVHVVMATRESRKFGLASMRAYGQLFEIGFDQLRFTVPEAAALLARSGHDMLSEQEVATLVERTEGWVSGLKLASLALSRAANRDAVLALFTGPQRDIASYFDEDVFSGQSEAVRNFLLQTSILERLTPGLCDAMTGRTGARAMLRQIEEQGLFIVSLDDEGHSYRYHSLFSSFLQRKLAESEPGAVEILHRRAANCLAGEGDVAGAMAHALRAGDFDLLAKFLEANAEEFTYAGKLGIIARFAGSLPDSVLAHSPWTAVSVAWLKVRAMRFAETRRLLEMASKSLAAMRAMPDADPDANERLAQTIRHREMMLAAARDDVGFVETECNQLLNYYADRRPYMTCSLHGQLMVARREQFRFDGLEKLHARGRSIAEQSGYRFAMVSLQAAAGVSLFAAGRTGAATVALNQGLEESLRWAGQNSGLSALVALPLADIAYEANDLSRAAELVDSHLPVARELSSVDQLVAGYIVRSRLHSARGDLAGARRALDEAMDIALECDLERLRLAVLHEQVRVLLRNGMLDAANRQAAQADLPKTAEACAPRSGASSRDELRALIWTRIAISRDKIADALAVAKQWRAFCSHHGAVRSLVRWNILTAQMLAIHGDGRAAQRMMRDANAIAASANLVRSFVDEGSAVLNILSEAYADSMHSKHPTDVFAVRVLDAFEHRRPTLQLAASDDDGLYGRLSEKELEILTMVGCGMRNREIGNRLGLSEGSVKWYMQQVYDKVGIRRRSQAVERARRFGLIS